MRSLNDHIYHHGIKGQKWGVRRFRNKDGSLTPAGKKRISKEYKQVSTRASNRLAKNYTKNYVDAHNEVADYMNRRGIEKFNESQRQKYGENYAQREGYQDEYFARCEKLLAAKLNQKFYDFYNSDPDIKRARELVKQYDMTKWDDLARDNELAIESVRRAVEEGR